MSTKVPIEAVLQICDPRLKWPWPCQAPEPDELAGLLSTAEEVAAEVPTTGSAAEHIGRIRFLARHGWSEPLEMDVGVPCLGYYGPRWPLIDGNHRLWAATLRGDKLIDIDVAGQVSHAATLLGVSEAQLLGNRVPPDASANKR